MPYTKEETQGCRQKNFQGEPTEKTKPKNSIIKPPSTLLVLCMKIQRGGHDATAPAADAHEETLS